MKSFSSFFYIEHHFFLMCCWVIFFINSKIVNANIDDDVYNPTYIPGPSTTMHVTDIRKTTFTINGFTAPPATSTTPYAFTTNIFSPEPSFQYINFSRYGDSYALGALVDQNFHHKDVNLELKLQNLYSFQLKEAFKCQLGILNEDINYLPNTYISYFIQETAPSISGALSNAKLMMQRNVFFNIGPSYTYQCMAVSGFYSPPSISFITPTSSSFQFDSEADGQYLQSFYSTLPSSFQEANAMVNIFSVFKWNYVAVVAEYNLEGISARLNIVNQMILRGLVPICVSYVSSDSPQLSRAFASCVLNSQARVVVIWADIALAGHVVHSFFLNSTSSDTEKKLTFIASHQWANMNPADIKIFKGSNRFPISFIYGTLGIVPHLGDYYQYDSCISNITSSYDDSTFFKNIWEDNFQCKIPSLKNQELPKCPLEIKDRLFSCLCDNNESFIDVPKSPHINYMQDAVSVAYYGLSALFNVSQCNSLNTSVNCNSDTFTPSDLNQAIKNNIFSGITGHLNFSLTQPTRYDAIFDIHQYRLSGIPDLVGFANNSGPFMIDELIRFNTYPDWPISLVPSQTSVFGTTFWSTMVGITSSLGILVHLICIYLMIVNRWTKIILKSNIVWFVMLSVSCIFIYLSNLFSVIPLDGGICSMILLFELLGLIFFSLSFVIKAQRFYRLLVSHRKFSDLLSLKEIIISSIFIFIPLITLVILIFALSGGMTVYFRIAQNRYDSIEQTVCDYLYSDQNTLTTITYWICTSLIGICAFVFAFSSPLKTWYSERYLLFTTSLSSFIVLVIVFPLQKQIRKQSDYVYQIFLLRTLASNFIMICTLVIIYIKKIGLIKSEYDEKNVKTDRNVGSVVTPSATVETVTAPYGGENDDMSDMSSITSDSSDSSERTLKSRSDDSILDEIY